VIDYLKRLLYIKYIQEYFVPVLSSFLIHQIFSRLKAKASRYLFSLLPRPFLYNLESKSRIYFPAFACVFRNKRVGGRNH